jgi:beta-carotene ketolase (CrtW type)
MQNIFVSNQPSWRSVTGSLTGITVASTIITLWLVSFMFLLSIDISKTPLFLVLAAVFLRTLLHTGLFITAHDAMHGVIFPKNRQANDFVGSIATTIYALLPYKQLLVKHRMHHRHPATQEDPDFHSEQNSNILAWYLRFMTKYLSGKQSWILLIGMSVVFYALMLGLQVPVINLILFWILPLLLSSVQLFYFGIFLPHREPKEGYRDRHRTNSNDYSTLWSFLSCYHFGYHWEHHEYPNVPWYQLPEVHKHLKAEISS